MAHSVFKQRLYDIINRDRKGDTLSIMYDWTMLILIIVSLIPLMMTSTYPIFRTLEWITIGAFVFDYIARWYTADIELHMGRESYIRYPFTFMAIVDMLSILPIVGLVSQLKMFRLFRLFRIFRMVTLTRYSRQVDLLLQVLRSKKDVLISVMMLALFYIFVTALIMFNAEPRINPHTGEETFHNFFDALYWSTVTLTSVGYGDLCPVTTIGRFISMISALFGIAIIAMPAGVITAGYMEVLRKHADDESNRPEAAN